jgi:guanylate kinase
MRQEIADKKFVEYAEVHGCTYGTSHDSIEAVWRSGRICLLDIDINGVKQLKQVSSLSCKYVFLLPPSMEELRRRLTDRGTETEEQIEGRMQAAQVEIDFASEEGSFDLVSRIAVLANNRRLQSVVYRFLLILRLRALLMPLLSA